MKNHQTKNERVIKVSLDEFKYIGDGNRILLLFGVPAPFVHHQSVNEQIAVDSVGSDLHPHSFVVHPFLSVDDDVHRFQ